MSTTIPAFRAPSPTEKIFNRVFGFLVGLGLGFPYNYLLQVRGRKSGKVYSTPIDLLERNLAPTIFGGIENNLPAHSSARTHIRSDSDSSSKVST